MQPTAGAIWLANAPHIARWMTRRMHDDHMPTPAHLQTVTGTPSLVGRFELRKLLGRGAQAAVWLAHDPLLQRDVALKLLHSPTDGHLPDEAQQWLLEARSLSRLVHPNIVTLFEADVYDYRPGLVLEYISGPSLAQHIQKTGGIPQHRAVATMVDILGALEAAHQQGVIHRDLKPTNILLDAAGHAKVTDFGLAVRLSGGESGVDIIPALPPGVVGTPGYLSPEAARGEAPRAVSDVFSAGLVLAEMLLGKPLVAEADPYRAIYRVAHEDLVLPNDPAHTVDDNLRALVHRALARDPSLRFASAADMAVALHTWSNAPTDSTAPETSDAANPATLDFLLRRMRRNSDFPAMSEQVLRVQNIASSDSESVNGLTNEILKDVALTNKVLRIVNSAHFSHVGAGHINTVSRAVSLIGFAGIRNVAMSLVLLDHMENKAHANQLKGEFVRALLAASLAADLRPPQLREGEEVFIGALFQNLGRMLTEFYLPDEAQLVRQAMAGPQRPNEDAASLSALGITYESLGQGVGKAWGLPDTMLRLMRKVGTAPPSRPPSDPLERMHWVTGAANELADVFLNTPDDQLARQVRKTSARYAAVLGQSTDVIERIANLARDKLATTADAIGLRVPAQSPAARLLKASQAAAVPAYTGVPGATALTATPAPLKTSGTPAPRAPAPAEAPSPQQAEQTVALLTQGIQDVSNALVADQIKLNDVLRMILETMFRAMSFRVVLLCLRDARTHTLQGRLGLGEGAAEAARLFKVDPNEAHNLFALVSNKGLDTLIHQAADPQVTQNLPDWYRQHIHAGSFMLLPLQLKGAPFGLIYADKAQADGIVLDEKGLSLLKTLRNQAVMAFRQAQRG